MSKKTWLAKFTDKLSLFVIFFITFYFVISRLLHQQVPAFIIASFLTILTYATLMREIAKRKKIKNSTAEDDKKTREIIFALRFGDPAKVKRLLVESLSSQYLVKSSKENIILSNNEKTIHLYYDFSTSVLDLKTVQSFIGSHNTKPTELYILGEDFSKDALTFKEQNKKLHFFDAKAIYLTFKKLNKYPTIKSMPATKVSIKTRLANSLNRTNALKYLKFGLLLLLLSAIIPYATYYRLAGSALLGISIISLFRPQNRPSTQPSTLLN